MRTLGGQAAISLCHLLFGLLALRMASRIPRSQPAFRWMWAFTGGAFVIRGANSAFHDAFSTFAFVSGPQSRAWASVLAWHPVLNHSRTFLLVAYCVVMCVAMLRADRRMPLPSLRTGLVVVVAGMGVGGLIGWQEEAFSGLTHFTAVAEWDIVELLAMMAVLLMGIYTASMDRGMWACLGVNAFVLALSVLWFAFLSRIDMGGEWSPRPYHIHSIKALLYVGMNLIALRQLRRLRRGVILRSFYDDPAPRPAMHALHP